MELIKEQNLIKSIVAEVNDLYFSNLDNLSIDISDKGKNDIVTNIDLSVENHVIDKIKKEFPDDNIISEETMNEGKLKDRNWIFDPVDGTCNFANNLPLFGFQIAFMDKEKPLISSILLPKVNELYFAKYNEGCYLNGKRIYVSNNTDLQKALVSAVDFKNPKDPNSSRQYLYEKLRGKILRFRMFGAACFDLSYVASGRTNAYLMFTKNLWDIIPGLLLVTEAGGCVSNFDGSEFDIDYGAYIFSSNKTIQNELIKNMESDNE